ncbi:hypothetical protein X777_03884 [Ooceraea biroi]|uniref:SAP domain-containing protein n=1 Tax=Ooceraea biroi TaxID=2015173 RepID=A0A026WJ86_OOCBI|nr:hypothetical protein X777_03884 [Ooceraea biroi]
MTRGVARQEKTLRIYDTRFRRFTMTEPSDFTVTELRTRAKALGLQIGGTKAEIIARLTVHDPTGGWMKDDDLIELGAVGKEVQDGAWNDADSGREREFADREKDLELVRREREIEFSNRERELMRRELELARREIDMLRRNDCASAVESEPRARDSREDAAMAASRLSTNLNLKMIAELVSEFDGTPDVFDVWERQVQFMKATYNLADDAAKTLIGMKLRKKAFEWLHSRAEHLAMTFDDLMSEIGRMYRPKQNKIDLRKKFEARVWKKDTGSDLTLMCRDEYVRIGSPPLRPTEVRFTGIGSPAHSALGEFQTEIVIDGHRFPILIRVVADVVSRQRLLIGTDFLESRNFHARKGMIYVDPDDDNDNLPEVLYVNSTPRKSTSLILTMTI